MFSLDVIDVLKIIGKIINVLVKHQKTVLQLSSLYYQQPRYVAYVVLFSKEMYLHKIISITLVLNPIGFKDGLKVIFNPYMQYL